MKLGGVALVAACVFVGPALATDLSTASDSVAAGSATIARCDPDGFSTVFVLSGSNVASVVVSGISAACGGATAKLALTNGSTTGTGTATIAAGGGSITVTVSPQPPVTNPNVLHTEIVVG